MEERRKGKRLELTAQLVLNAIGSNDESKSVSIDITDASQYGIGFNSKEHLTIGDNYEAFLTIWTKEVIHVFLQIIRAAQIDNGFNYGAIYIGMPDTDRQRIAVYGTVNDTTEKMNKNK